MTSIGYQAFNNDSNLRDADFPVATSIDTYAFLNCANITNINVPNAVTFIGSENFMNCPKLKSFTVNTPL